MKKIILLFSLFPLWGLGGIYAQKELWGVSAGYGESNSVPEDPYYFGNIIKYDINGENSQIIHEFDQVNGKTPLGRLFLASNGKLYGTTQKGGVTSYTLNGVVYSAPDGFGTIYEYDLILNKFRVVKVFQGINDGIYSQIGFIEPTPGVLYGGSNSRIIKYNINTETTTVFGGFTNLLNSEFIKGVTISPNPNSGIFFINVESFKTTASATLYDIEGKELNSYTLQKGENKIQKEGLATGTYLVKLNVDGQSETKQLIIK